ncbi:MAG: DUF5717 family protein [Coprococcus sp.]
MKEKIQLLSRGVFEYENPAIDVSEESIELEVEYGSRYSGYFDLVSRNNIEIRAMIFSSNKWMQCLENTIVGVTGRVHYVFDTQAMEIGESSEGRFHVVSNGGEITIPYKVHVRAPYCETSMGSMNELDRFAVLARENWAEALKIFRAPDFRRVFLNNKKNQKIYDVLIKSHDQALAMEEFLCTIRRKQPVSIAVSQEIIEFENLDHVVSEKLLIEKSQWGHVKIDVRAEGSFLTVYKQIITDEDFLGSYYQLEYQIRPDICSTSHGRIILETFNQKIEIPVCCSRDRSKREGYRERGSLKASWMGLYQKYLRLQLKQMTKEQWISEAREEIDGCINNSKESIYRVVEADYLLLSGSIQEAQNILDTVNGRELRYKSAIAYSYYLYVCAKCKNDEHYTQFVRDTIQFYTEGQYQDRWELLYMLMKLDNRESDHYSRLFRSMKELHGRRLPGGFLYLEAAGIVNQDPSVIREMGSFEISLLLWGVRHECLNREAVFRFADLVLKMRSYHGQCLHAMMNLCSLYETKNLLSAVLHLLILGDRKEPQFHHWYQLGIKSSIKMQELYEYYMETLDLNTCTELPISVLIYFQYDNRLQLEQKAFLFRYVIEHKDKLGRLFETYDGIIKAFTFEQLRKGLITENIAVLYRYYLTKEAMTSHVVQALPSVIFKQHLHCEHPGIKGVIVDCSELEKEVYYPLVHGNAYIDLFMDDYRIVLVDDCGSRYMTSVDYELEKLLDPGKYIRECYEQCRDNQMIILNRSERALKYQMMDDVSIETYKRVLRLKEVSRHYQKTILKNLIDFYYDNYEGETLEKYLLQIDICLLGHTERSHIIEYFIQRGLFDKAYKAITVYGYEGIQDKRIMRLCSRIIRENNFEKDDLLVEMAYFAFSRGKYDESILQYLIRFYTGTTSNLYAIWKAAKDFEVTAFELEERLLCQILFTETLIGEGCEVFISYYGDHPSQRMIKAFLGYYAYRYLVHEWTANQQIFQLMEIELDQMEQARDVCSLALLKYYAGVSHVEPEYYEKLRQEVASFMDQGILLPFFRNYAGSVWVPEELSDLSYVEYHSGSKNTVTIHYRLPGRSDDEFIHEPMRHVFGGIFVKAFRLYAGEELIYYISENDGNEEKTFERRTLKEESKQDNHLETGIDQLNRMFDYAEFHDDLALDEALKLYDRLDEMTDQLFQLK